MVSKTGIKIPNRVGTWYVIDEAKYSNGAFGLVDFWLLEHEQYGDETACIIVLANTDIIVIDEVYNGFGDLEEYLDPEEGWQ